jgi:MATE family multidrug resistance protein
MTFPTMLFFLCLFFQLTTNLIYIGQTAKPEDKVKMIEGIGMTHTYLEITFLPFAVGLIGGFETLGSNAYGMKNYKLFGLYYQRGLIIALSFAVVMTIVHYFTAIKFLALFGIDAQVLIYLEEYLHVTIFFIIPDIVFSANHRYINIVSKSYVNLIILVITICLHPLWCYIYIVLLDLGIKGAGLAIVTSQCLNALFGCIYIWGIKPCPESVFCINRDSFRGLWSYLKIAIPSTLLVCAEWWSIETQALITLWASNDDFAAQTLLNNISLNLYTISIGFGVPSVVFVGKLITNSTISKTKRYAKVIFFYGLIVMSIAAGIVVLFRDQIIHIFMKDSDTQTVVSKAVKATVIVCAANVLDYIQNNFAGVLRGLGKQLIASVVTFVNCWLIQSSLAILFGIYFKLGVFGVWMGIACGYLLNSISYFIVLVRLDYPKVQKEIIERVEKDNEDVKKHDLLIESSNDLDLT